MPTIPTTSTAVKAAIAADKAAKLIPTGKQLLGGGAKFGGAVSTPAAVGAAAILGITEGLFPRSTVSEADEQRAIRQAEAKKKEKSNPNLDYPSSPRLIESVPSNDAGFTGGQGAGQRYHVEWELNYTNSFYDRTTTSGLHSGPIRGFYVDASRSGDSETAVYLIHSDSNNPNREVISKLFSSTSSNAVLKSASIKQIYKADGTTPDDSGAPPDFYGGQVAGAQYIASCNWGAAGGNPGFSVGGNIVTGPILSINCSARQGWSTNASYSRDVTYLNRDGKIETHSLSYTQSNAHLNLKPYKTVTPYPNANTPYPGETNPPIPDNNIYSETNPPLPVQPLAENDVVDISAPTNKELAQKLAGLIREGKIDDGRVTPGVRDELKKIIAADNAISDKTKVVDNLNNSDGYVTAYSDGYADGFSALLEKDRLNSQNKANNLNVAIPKPTTQAQQKQKPTAVTTTVKTATRSKVKEPTTETKYFTAGKTPIKQTTVTNKSTGVKTITQEVGDTGKVVSIKRVIPAGVSTTNLGVSSKPISKTNTATFKAIGTPSNTGVGVTAIPQVPTIEQTPSTPQVAGGVLSAAAIAAAVYSAEGMENLTSAAAEGTCRTTQPGGCMQNNVVNPLKADLGTLFNNIANTGLAAQNAAIQTIVQNTNDIVKHSTYGLQAIQEAAGKAWEATHMDKVINVANLLVATHNAAMLSRNVGETIAELGTSVLQVFGIKNPVTGEAIDVGEVIGDTIQTAINSIVPEAIRTNVSSTWIKLNRIHGAAVAMASAITATKNAVLEANEVIGDWVAKIGNTQQEQGIVEEDSYPWMHENVQFKNPYEGFLGKLNNAEEVIESASSFVNAAIELQDSIEQVTTSKEELNNALNQFNTTKATEETAKEAESTSPEIDRLDLIQLEPDEIEP